MKSDNAKLKKFIEDIEKKDVKLIIVIHDKGNATSGSCCLNTNLFDFYMETYPAAIKELHQMEVDIRKDAVKELKADIKKMKKEDGYTVV